MGGEGNIQKWPNPRALSFTCSTLLPHTFSPQLKLSHLNCRVPCEVITERNRISSCLRCSLNTEIIFITSSVFFNNKRRTEVREQTKKRRLRQSDCPKFCHCDCSSFNRKYVTRQLLMKFWVSFWSDDSWRTVEPSIHPSIHPSIIWN